MFSLYDRVALKSASDEIMTLLSEYANEPPAAHHAKRQRAYAQRVRQILQVVSADAFVAAFDARQGFYGTHESNNR
ncbi:MAG: hypothetical protein FWF81_03755 [Defluviitaleaceae bacterium]|nr:hypothetical protein [Defluviitaleaceae bacterium]